MNIKIPGLIKQKLKSGNGYRYRVRQAGNPNKKTTVVPPTHKDFHRQYELARMGITDEQLTDTKAANPGTFSFLVNTYLDYLNVQKSNGLLSPLTVKKRTNLLKKLLRMTGNKEISHSMSTPQVVKIRDALGAHPTTANETVRLLSNMYEFGIERGYCTGNPAKGVKPMKKPKPEGATPWTFGDFQQFCRFFPKGTMAYLVLHILAFTGCRIGDVRVLSKKHEVKRQGVTYLEFQPVKKNSSFVSVPMLSQLKTAIQATPLTGMTYVVNEYGKQFATADALSQRFSKWCKQAGLEDRSAHGIRKSVATILAEHGHTTEEIMATLGHTEAETTAIYTKSAERSLMATKALNTLSVLTFD